MMCKRQLLIILLFDGPDSVFLCRIASGGRSSRLPRISTLELAACLALPRDNSWIVGNTEVGPKPFPFRTVAEFSTIFGKLISQSGKIAE